MINCERLSDKNRKHKAARFSLNRPMQVADAIRRVRVWLDHLRVEILTPGDRHAEILFDVLTRTGYRRRPHYGCTPGGSRHRIPRRTRFDCRGLRPNPQITVVQPARTATMIA